MVISNPYILGLLMAAVVIAVLHLLGKYLVDKPFWRKNKMYPPDHALARTRALRFVDLIAAHPALDDEEIAKRLTDDGVPKVDAELLVLFVPMAFTWMLLRKMGASSFPSTFIVFDAKKRPVELPLAREHYFAAALAIGEEVMTHGFSERINRATFKAIITRSPEMDAANKMLASGEDVAGSSILPPTLLGISAEEIAASRSH